ncbi:MAG TPA: hypothetical protein VMD08_14035, partial [Candidatus Baltobacteraceae bacterium]|nr:hypothetical protein [Candidatus Baltobacteraceae bacterium]
MSPKNSNAWHKIRERYGEAIYRLPRSERVWAVAEDLIEVDKAQGISMAQWLQEHGDGGAKGFNRIVLQFTEGKKIKAGNAGSSRRRRG